MWSTGIPEWVMPAQIQPWGAIRYKQKACKFKAFLWNRTKQGRTTRHRPALLLFQNIPG
ncbi:hypothetical protein TG4357_00027 [Thalassovita gelatinovora]|uniref:Uncharacterized protein n=1 Tax=Thalassovita gelatinovora TaxID=53501 RepID=A0A0P1F3S4_THAGE|nr:hypothetical protein TG4357_00027 [Thalassovita gelatinovora]SER16031.1 hypothetical protein SAMN04488043_11828 [Thalassovita gelatinovora]